nr:MAG TPA: hypothetical protein [Caudoviricetes sp.]
MAGRNTGNNSYDRLYRNQTGNVKGSLIRSPLCLWRSQAPPLTHHSKGSNLFR